MQQNQANEKETKTEKWHYQCHLQSNLQPLPFSWSKAYGLITKHTEHGEAGTAVRLHTLNNEAVKLVVKGWLKTQNQID